MFLRKIDESKRLYYSYYKYMTNRGSIDAVYINDTVVLHTDEIVSPWILYKKFENLNSMSLKNVKRLSERVVTFNDFLKSC